MPVEKVPEVWPHVMADIGKALARSGDYSLADAGAMLADGIWRLWIAAKPSGLVAAALTEVLDYPRRRVLHVHAAGGAEGEGVSAMWPLVRIYARQHECAVLRFQGRRGWARSTFIPREWRHVADIVEVEA